MKTKLLTLWSNAIVRGTSLFWIGSMAVNFGGFMYHLVIARMLGPQQYGILAALLSLTYFVSIPIGALDLLVTKMVAGFEPNSLLSHTKALIYYLYRRLGLFFLLSILPLVFFSPQVQRFLNSPDVIGVYLTWLLLFLSLLVVILRSALKGLLQFPELIINQVIDVAARLLLSIVLVTWLFPSNYLGGQLGTILATLVAFVLLIYLLRPVFNTPSSPYSHHHWPLKSLGLGSLVLSAAYSSMYSIDVILVKHFFSEYQAGLYAILATAGKIVFFAEAPISSALIPLVARKSSHPHQARLDLIIVSVATSIIGLATVGLYYFFPKLLINAVFGPRYLAASSLLPLMGLALSFYSLANISASFLLALGHLRSSVISLIALLAQVSLIFMFHGSLSQVIVIMTAVFGILAAVLLGYSLYVTRAPAKS